MGWGLLSDPVQQHLPSIAAKALVRPARMRSAPAENGVFALCSLLVVGLSLTVGVRRQLQQIPRILKIPGATGEVTKTAGAVAQVSDSEHERFWHMAGSNLLS
jgi:hypothetical protein